MPPRPLRREVRTLKEEVRDRFGAAHALKSPAHITLRMPFRRDPDQEASLIRHLGTFASGQTVFKVALQGFGCFAPRVIFIRIADHEPVIRLHEDLLAALQQCDPALGWHHPRRMHPHMTIATRDLPEAAFHRAWPEFQQRPFEASFMVDSICLLKHNGRHWDILRKFSFSAT